MELIRPHHLVAVQILRQIQGGGQGGTVLILQYPEIGLEEPLLPLVLFLEDKSQVLTVIDEILQPSPLCILQAGDPRQAAPGLQQGALPDGLHTQSVQGQPDLSGAGIRDVVVVRQRQPHPLRHRG